jgi:hypothetical protein
MTRRQSAFAYVALLLGVIAFASSFVRPSVGQQPVPTPAPVGRYQIAVAGEFGGDVYVIDTATGKTWFGIRTSIKGEIEWSEMSALPITK